MYRYVLCNVHVCMQGWIQIIGRRSGDLALPHPPPFSCIIIYIYFFGGGVGRVFHFSTFSFFYHPSGKGVRIPNFIRASHNSFLNFWYPEFVLVCMYNRYVMDHYRIDEDPDLPLDIKYFLRNINIYSFTAELLPGWWECFEGVLSHIRIIPSMSIFFV